MPSLYRAPKKHQIHIPHNWPCEICGKGPAVHRVGHHADGDPCEYRDKEGWLCGLRPYQHKVSPTSYSRRPQKQETIYYGIDGEGIGRNDHRYIMLAASSQYGTESLFIEADPTNPNARITTVQFLEFILKLHSKNIKVFSYAFNYDLTKGLADLDNESLFKLFRPDLRQRKGKWAHLGPFPVEWKQYELNLQGTKFTVKKDKQRVVVWDLFKFFQTKFVGALRSWAVGGEELLKRMSAKKDQRSEFDRLYKTLQGRQEIKEYCLEECMCMGQLAAKLVKAHDDAELTLKSYYGAGSSSTAMLERMGVKDQITPINPLMKHAVAAGFIGGRFENSVTGSIKTKLYNKDISSAYPYHTTFLPCLVHGTWKLTKNRNDIEKAHAALVHYKLGEPSPRDYAGNWGPFPFREPDGTVTFPIRSGGGWVWKAEYLSGERVFGHVQFVEAWVYQTRCECKPFSQIPEFYVMRLNLGKESAGNAIKLAINGCYGKLAQSVGNAVFNQWIWAGIITSGCRAQGLDLMGAHKDRRNLLLIATDGLISSENVHCPAPMPTGTGMLVPCGCKGKCIHPNKMVSKPLGGWEGKTYPDGLFFARPGIYFPLNPTEDDIKDIKGRGLGKAIILKNWKRIVEHWETKRDSEPMEVAEVPRFCGAKTSISKSRKAYRRANHKPEPCGCIGPCTHENKMVRIKPAYGQWVGRKIDMNFNPRPKRAGFHKDGIHLTLVEYPITMESAPYRKSIISQEAAELKAAEEMAIEQPDLDYREW